MSVPPWSYLEVPERRSGFQKTTGTAFRLNLTTEVKHSAVKCDHGSGFMCVYLQLNCLKDPAD